MATDDRTDVLVIGAGAAGAAVAWRLARAGIGVVCLEQGDWVDPRAYPHWGADWELHRHTDWSAEPNVRRLPQDYPINDTGSSIAPLMYNAVGGSTIHWSAHFPRFRPSDSAILTRDYDGRRACVNCGPCDLGCPIGAKASTDVTYWPKALAAGARLLTRARVREITLGPDGLADGAIYYDRAGNLHAQKARALVLAANGVGTPRLLLNSRSARFPDGLANRSGLVGRHLMFHPYAMVRGVFDGPLGGHRGPIGCSIISQEFYETDLARGFVRGYSFQVARGLSPIASANGGSVGDRVPWGREHRRAYDDRFDRTITVAIIGEDLPEAGNRVDLDPTLADGQGIPAPRVSYTLSDNSRRMLDHGIARAREALEAAGAHEVAFNPLLRAGGWHLMGTARMGRDPATSVIDAEGRCHDVPNLYIVDGSTMVTCAGVNPTSTIQAVALYIAEGMIRRRA